MQIDKNTLVSDDQNLAQAIGAYLSTYSIDLKARGTTALGGTTPGDVGKNKLLDFIVQVTQTFTSGGAGTLQVELITADDAALTTNVTSWRNSGAIALATLKAGYRFGIGGQLPEGITQRYLGLRFTIGTAAMTAGLVTAGLVLDA